MLAVTNEKARDAARLFRETEGNDIHPASAVATASLVEVALQNRVAKDAIIMLNITGGGEERYKAENKLWYLKPSLVFPADPDPAEVKDKASRLFR